MNNDKNVYILGAGFSREAELPLQYDFLSVAREVYFSNSAQYPHFEKVFHYRDELSKAKNYLSLDLLNLESLFNLLEMHVFYDGSAGYINLRHEFINLIKDVLIAKTPSPIKYLAAPSSPNVNDLYNLYLSFLKAMITINPLGDGYGFDMRNDTLITLNYDLIIEISVALFNHFETKAGRGRYRNQIQLNSLTDLLSRSSKLEEESPHLSLQGANDFEFLFNTSSIYNYSSPIKLIKLHGSINWKNGSDTFLIPPSWNKSDSKVKALWENAYKELQTAKRIIVIGYSFPETDIYIKSLLALALNSNQILQKIIFINPDNDEGRRRALSIVDDHFKSYCDYKPWTFRQLISSLEGQEFMRAGMDRPI